MLSSARQHRAPYISYAFVVNVTLTLGILSPSPSIPDEDPAKSRDYCYSTPNWHSIYLLSSRVPLLYLKLTSPSWADNPSKEPILSIIRMTIVLLLDMPDGQRIDSPLYLVVLWYNDG